MKYSISITWNGNMILQGKCSAVMAWENLRYMAAQFGNAEKAGLTIPTLVDLANAKAGTVFTGGGADETGSTAYTLIVLEN